MSATVLYVENDPVPPLYHGKAWASAFRWEKAHHLTPRSGGYPFLLLTVIHPIAGEYGPGDLWAEGRKIPLKIKVRPARGGGGATCGGGAGLWYQCRQEV